MLEVCGSPQIRGDGGEPRGPVGDGREGRQRVEQERRRHVVRQRHCANRFVGAAAVAPARKIVAGLTPKLQQQIELGVGVRQPD